MLKKHHQPAAPKPAKVKRNKKGRPIVAPPTPAPPGTTPNPLATYRDTYGAPPGFSWGLYQPDINPGADDGSPFNAYGYTDSLGYTTSAPPPAAAPIVTSSPSAVFGQRPAGAGAVGTPAAGAAPRFSWDSFSTGEKIGIVGGGVALILFYLSIHQATAPLRYANRVTSAAKSLHKVIKAGV